MYVPKKELRDCMMIGDLSMQEGVVKIECGFYCAKCGHNRKVAEQRKRRIESGDFSFDTERGLYYLLLHDDE